VILIGRQATLAPLGEGPIDLNVPSGAVTLSTDPTDLAQADCVVLAMKSHGLDAAIDQVAAHTDANVPVISLLNGLDAMRRLRARLRGRDLVAGMVPFNVVWSGPRSLNRTGASMTSMASDILAGRPTEIDVINGEILRIGKACGMATTVNAALVALIKHIENGARTGRLSAPELLAEVGL